MDIFDIIGLFCIIKLAIFIKRKWHAWSIRPKESQRNPSETSVHRVTPTNFDQSSDDDWDDDWDDPWEETTEENDEETEEEAPEKTSLLDALCCFYICDDYERGRNDT